MTTNPIWSKNKKTQLHQLIIISFCYFKISCTFSSAKFRKKRDFFFCFKN